MATEVEEAVGGKRKRAAKVKNGGKAKNGKRAAKTAKAPRAAKAAGEGKSIIDASKYTYEASDVKTASGRKSIDCGDRLAAAMRGLSNDDLMKAVKANKLEPKSKLEDLNPGQRRMVVGNMLRAAIRKGTSVSIGGKSIASL